jgi:hypothetical protein
MNYEIRGYAKANKKAEGLKQKGFNITIEEHDTEAGTYIIRF